MSVDINKVSPPRKIQTYGDLFDAVQESLVNEVTEKVVSEINLYGGLGNKLIYSTAKDVGYLRGSTKDKKSLHLNIHHTERASNNTNQKISREEVSPYGNLFTSYAPNQKKIGNQYLKRYLLLFLINYAINLSQYEKCVNALMDILKLPEDEIHLLD